MSTVIHCESAFFFLRTENDIARIRAIRDRTSASLKASTDSKRRNIEAVLDKQARDVRDAMPCDSAFPEGA